MKKLNSFQSICYQGVVKEGLLVGLRVGYETGQVGDLGLSGLVLPDRGGWVTPVRRHARLKTSPSWNIRMQGVIFVISLWGYDTQGVFYLVLDWVKSKIGAAVTLQTYLCSQKCWNIVVCRYLYAESVGQARDTWMTGTGKEIKLCLMYLCMRRM